MSTVTSTSSRVRAAPNGSDPARTGLAGNERWEPVLHTVTLAAASRFHRRQGRDARSGPRSALRSRSLRPRTDHSLERWLTYMTPIYIYISIPRVRVNANDGRFVVVRALDPPPPPRISNSGFLSSKFSLGSHSLESPPRVDHHITTVDRDLYARRHPWRRTPRSRLSPSDPPSNLFPSSPLTQSPKRPCRTAG